MGFELYRMIRDGAPASWTAIMRLVAGVIADDARDPTQGMPDDGGPPWSAIRFCGYFTEEGEWRDGFAERTGMSERAISRALSDLARAGYEMREQVGIDKRGRPVFTYPNRGIRYRVPLLPPRECPPNPATITAGGQPAKVARSDRNGRQNQGERSPDSASHLPQVFPRSSPGLNGPVVNSSLEGTRDGQTGDTGAERRRQEKALAEWIREHPQPPESASAGSIDGDTTP